MQCHNKPEDKRQGEISLLQNVPSSTIPFPQQVLILLLGFFLKFWKLFQSVPRKHTQIDVNVLLWPHPKASSVLHYTYENQIR